MEMLATPQSKRLLYPTTFVSLRALLIGCINLEVQARV